MKLTNLTSLLSRQGVAAFIYGFSGSGKTACCRNLPPKETVFITCEPWGLRSLEAFGWNEIQAAVPTDALSYEVAVKQAIADGARYLVLDTITRFYDLCELLHERNTGIGREVGGKITFDRMGFCKSLTERLIDICLVGVQRGTNLIVLCHEKDSPKDEHEIGLTGQLPENLARCMDLVLHTRKIQLEGKPAVYELELLFGDSYGKDLFRLTWPKPNDIMAVMAECQRRLAPSISPAAQTQGPPVGTDAIHPPAPAVNQPLTPAPLYSPPLPAIPPPRSRTRATTPPLEKPEEKMVRINGGLAVPEEATSGGDIRANLPFSDGEADCIKGYNDIVLLATASGKSQTFVDQLLEINAGKRMHPWPQHVLAMVRQIVELDIGEPTTSRRRRKPKFQENPVTAAPEEHLTVPPPSKDEIPF